MLKPSEEAKVTKEDAPVRPLRDKADYEAALTRFERYFDDEPERDTPEGDNFELLGLVIAKYEDEHFPIGAADPVQVIELVMEGRGLSRKDLAEVLGSASRASEILKRRRDLSIDHIRRLHSRWGIPADALIGPAVEAA
jgi:HTH-type transcriptional regulator/antitoxin HigA